MADGLHGIGASAEPQLETERLLLRRWRRNDLELLAALNADAEVMEHFPARLSRQESEDLLRRLEGSFEQRGYGCWAVEIPGVAPLIGFVGLGAVRETLHFAPAVEVAWRLARPYWGEGFASEAAVASLQFGFEELGLEEIVAYTAARNTRSRSVMERVGMSYDADADFMHPDIDAADSLAAHVVYRLARPDTP
jgi:RimJ/RimL family protein N-acetyltransferase